MAVTDKLRELRERAGLSKRKMAELLGFKGPSSYLRYEDPALYRKDMFPVDLTQRLASVLAGRGQPVISRQEVLSLAGLEALTAKPGQREIMATLEALNRSCEAGDLEAAAAYCAILGGYIALTRKPVNVD